MSGSFVKFPKIPRLFRDIIVTEKIDGTNARLFIVPEGLTDLKETNNGIIPWIAEADGLWIAAGSRKRWIHPGDDNFGFAAWVWENTKHLVSLGPGHHYGEWAGYKIQRGYGMDTRRFVLFDVPRYREQTRPAGVDMVPVLYEGPFDLAAVDRCLDYLFEDGSVWAPGFNKPEGIVIYHTASNHLYKVTLEKDDQPKGTIL